MNKILRYYQFNESNTESSTLPTYEDCVQICSRTDAAFYEIKVVIDGFNVSVFNYRLAQYKDFVTPLLDRPDLKAYEMRGLCFVFNEDNTVFNRFILLEKFFNLNQVPESMYSIIKNYKIKYINNKEDGSIASFIQLPNNKIIGKSKMGFDNQQANGINRLYRTRPDIKRFVDWCIKNDITAIFEYVAPANRIVLTYLVEDLILLRMRNNLTGRHLDINNYINEIGSIKIAPFEEKLELDNLIEVNAKSVDKEGVVVHVIDDNDKDFFFKIKTPWYIERHGLLTYDLYREHIIINYILDDKIDDILGQIPEDEKITFNRINKIIGIVKNTLDEKVKDIEISYQIFLDMNSNKKLYALKYYRKDPNFPYVIRISNGTADIYETAKEWLKKKTSRLNIARAYLKDEDSSLFFEDIEDEHIENDDI